MRDLKRSNAKLPAYKQLEENGMEVFTPMKWRIAIRRGKRIREKIPAISDLLFVHDRRSAIDTWVAQIPTLQYRYLRGGYCQPMTVQTKEMDQFIHAVQNSEDPCYYQPGELTSAMCGRMIRIIGGPLDGYEGHLLTVRGSRKRRLIVELSALLSVGVEVNPEYIQLL